MPLIKHCPECLFWTFFPSKLRDHADWHTVERRRTETLKRMREQAAIPPRLSGVVYPLGHGYSSRPFIASSTDRPGLAPAAPRKRVAPTPSPRRESQTSGLDVFGAVLGAAAEVASSPSRADDFPAASPPPAADPPFSGGGGDFGGAGSSGDW